MRNGAPGALGYFRQRVHKSHWGGGAGMGQEQDAPERATVSIRMLRPAAALSGLVDAYYIVETFGPMQDRYLAGPGNIRFRTKGDWVLTIDGVVHPTPQRAALFGPTDRSGMFGPRDAGVMLGAGLTPSGWVTLFDVAAAEMSGKVCELAAMIGAAESDAIAGAIEAAADDAGIAAALDRWLIARVAARPSADPRIAAINRALLSVPHDVGDLARAADVSERTLQRLCVRAFGFPPKELLRQKRFQRTLERVRGVLDQPLTGLIDEDYYDQAHFNRDFRHYMGMTPLQYFHSPREIMRRSAEVRRSLNGAGVQGLHPSAGRDAI